MQHSHVDVEVPAGKCHGLDLKDDFCEDNFNLLRRKAKHERVEKLSFEWIGINDILVRTRAEEFLSIFLFFRWNKDGK